MQKANLAYVITAATDERQTDPLALAVRDSIEVGVVVPSILRLSLAHAGFGLVDDEVGLAAYGFRSSQVLKRVLISRDGAIVAMGAAGDEAEALLHAVLGWFREHPLPDAEVPAGLTTLEQEG